MRRDGIEVPDRRIMLGASVCDHWLGSCSPFVRIVPDSHLLACRHSRECTRPATRRPARRAPTKPPTAGPCRLCVWRWQPEAHRDRTMSTRRNSFEHPRPGCLPWMACFTVRARPRTLFLVRLNYIGGCAVKRALRDCKDDRKTPRGRREIAPEGKRDRGRPYVGLGE